MRIGIIGYGKIGQALTEIHDRNMIMYYDPKLEEWQQWTIEKIVKNCGWIYLCLPTELKEDNTYDTSVLLSVLDEIKDYEGIVISRSNAMPKFYNDIVKQCGVNLKYKFRLLYMPLFTNSDNALQELMHPEYIVLGGNMRDVNYAAQFIVGSDMSYKHKAKIIKTDIASAVAIKFYIDSFLSTKTIFNTQYNQWAKTQGIEWASLAEHLKEHKNLGASNYELTNSDGDVGYSQPYVIETVSALLHSASEENIDLSLINLQVDYNHQIKEEQAQQRELDEQTRSSLRRRREDRIARAVDRKPRRR